jgi:hypothetical protein
MMNRSNMRVFLGVLISIVFATSTLASGEDVDWKFYRSAKIGGDELCFFDAKGVVLQSDGHFRAWTKCLEKGELEDVLKKEDGNKIVDSAGRRFMSGYATPLRLTVLSNTWDGCAVYLPLGTSSLFLFLRSGAVL